MAKTGEKPTAKATSKSRKRYKRNDDDTQDPPIIVKGGALPGVKGENNSMEIHAEDPMDFSYLPNEKNPARYSYPTEVVNPISSIVVTRDGKVFLSLSVDNATWEIILQPSQL